MKQRINLYLPELRPVKDLLSLNNIALAWLLTAVLTGGYSAVMFYLDQQAAKEQQQLTMTLNRANSHADELQAALQQKQDKTHLNGQLARLKQEYQHKQMMFDYIAARNQDDAVNYAHIMKDLAKYHNKHIWLTEIKFINKEIEFKGVTAEPSQLPIWFEGLKQSMFFSGKSFSTLEFSTINQSELVEFTVATVKLGAEL